MKWTKGCWESEEGRRPRGGAQLCEAPGTTMPRSANSFWPWRIAHQSLCSSTGIPHSTQIRTLFRGSVECGMPVEEHKDWCADRKSTRLNSSHLGISYAVFCLKK